ncbi:MAG: helix-turn-helix domain-containing protein [Bacteriovoracaceae bacterium]
MKTKLRHRRTEEIKLTKEARVLKELRLLSGFSIRESARRLAKSEAYLRHIEKGRLDVPSGEDLQSILDVYGVSKRLFNSKCKQTTDESVEDQLIKLVKSLGLEKQKVLLSVGRNL